MARELILKLGKKITDRVDVKLGMTKLDENSPEYYGLASVVTDEMAELALAMKVRVPTTPAEIGKKVGKDPVYVEQLFDQMSMIGLLEYNWENPERAKQWVLPMLVPGSAEFLNMRVSQLEEHPVYAKFFEQASKGPLSKATPMVPPGGAGIGMHVIPVEKAIDAASTSVPIEHIEHWLDLGGEDVIALGGDWDGATVPAFLSDASKMPEFQNMLSKHFGKTVMQKLCSDNALAFFERY